MVERINQRHGPPKAYEDHAEQGKLSKTPNTLLQRMAGAKPWVTGDSGDLEGR